MIADGGDSSPILLSEEDFHRMDRVQHSANILRRRGNSCLPIPTQAAITIPARRLSTATLRRGQSNRRASNRRTLEISRQAISSVLCVFAGSRNGALDFL